MRTVVVSGAPSPASARGGRSRPAAPAIDKLVRKRRRVCVNVMNVLPRCASRLQLAFELVKKAPIGAVGDDLLWRSFDCAVFAKAQGVEADCVLGIVVTPFVIRKV